MRKSAVVLLVLSVLILVVPSYAQPGAESPFTLSVARDKTEVIPGTVTLRLALVLDVPKDHKIYHSSVKLSFPGRDPVKLAEFAVPLGVKIDDPAVPPGETVLKGRNVLLATLVVEPQKPGLYSLKPVVEFQGCSDKLCYPPESRAIALDVEKRDEEPYLRIVNVKVLQGEAEPVTGGEDLESLIKQIEAQHDFARTVEARGYAIALLAAFGSGVLVSLTPCVWPLIPIVLAVVGASAEGSGWKRGLRLSAAYVFGMSLTYAALGAVAGVIGKSAQSLAQSPWLIGVVCLVFVALALSMFGLYDIALPAGLTGRLQKQRGAGFLGILVTGILSGLVASPCVSAPLLGLFAGVASLGSIGVGMVAGFIFAWGMGTILVVAGTSSKALQSLPKSGEWMVVVKDFFGWVMLGVAVWFSHMVIGTTAYRVLMGTLLIAAVLFLAVIRPVRPESTWKGRLPRTITIAVLLVGLVYLASGSAKGGVQWVASVEEGLARAKAESKPAIIDFTADWCTYCHEMDREVLGKPAVVAESKRFVMIKRDVTVHGPRVDELYRQYGVVAPPAFVFVESNGRQHTLNRKLKLDTFLRVMRATR